METMQIDIVNRKAKKIIKELADQHLINIRTNSPVKAFQELLNRLRSKKPIIPLAEITQEVELVRSKRYGKKG
jgi:DNA-binding transcriptional regulator LsrR (DeoR family)